jgi:hypothetical protein
MRNSTKIGGSIKKKKYQIGGGAMDPKKTTGKMGAVYPPAPTRSKMAPSMAPSKKSTQIAPIAPMTRATSQMAKSSPMVAKPAVQSTPPVAEETMSARDRMKKAARIDNKMDRLRNKSFRIQKRYNNSTNEKREHRLMDKVYAIGDKKGALRKERNALTNYTEASMSKGGRVEKKMASGGAVIQSPIQTRLGNKPMAGGNMAKGGALKKVNPIVNPGLAELPTPVRNKMGYMKKGGAHPGFKAVQAKIAAKQGVSKKAAGAILAAGARKASAKAKAANPRLKRVK